MSYTNLVERLQKAEQLLTRINHAFYVDGSAKALRPVMAETKPLLAELRESLAMEKDEATP